MCRSAPSDCVCSPRTHLKAGGAVPRRPWRFLAGALLAVGLTALGPVIAAQGVPSSQPSSLDAAIAEAMAQGQAIDAPPATLTYANRPIFQFRASVLGRTPADRAAAVRQVLDRLVDSGARGRVEIRTMGPVTAIVVGAINIFGIVPADVDTLAGETMAESASQAASRLQAALDEVFESRRPRVLLFAALQVLLATIVFVAIAWGLVRARRSATRRFDAIAIRHLQETVVGDDEFVRSSRIIDFLHHLVTVVIWVIALFVAYSWLTFSLRRFPYTRFWGESLRGFLIDHLSLVGTAILGALPGLFTVLIIVLLTRFVSRIVHLYFQAVEDRRISVPWLYPETAQPTRKLVGVAIWLFAVATAYPYLPGSESDAFKGVSVFVGLMVSLGATGLVNQVMSGFTLTYSRALRLGDFVEVGDVAGTVTQMGTLSTKIRTPRNEDVTIPNAVIVGQTIINHSRRAETEGVFVPTHITIGYDVAWRQVEALLLLAAARTPGVRREPKPMVRQTALEDACVKYTLLFCLEDPTQRGATLAAVHANILDAFNEYEVQITSPRYEADPAAPKVVPRDRWYAAPARPDGQSVALPETASGASARSHDPRGA